MTKYASIICVGSELTIGETQNTYGHYIAQKLSELGYIVKLHMMVNDELTMIVDAIQFASERSDCIILTGGLGPTMDDLTRFAIADAYKLPLIQNELAKRKLIDRFKHYNIKMTDNNLQQIKFPQNAMIYSNDLGSADAFKVEGKCTIFALPGPPREMKHVLTKYVLPELSHGKKVFEKVLKLQGAGESTIDQMIADILPSDERINTGIYAKDGVITIRLSASTDHDNTAEQLLSPYIDKLKNRLTEYIYADREISLAEALANQLIEHGVTISFAESCTGGALAKALTDIAGISSIYRGSLVTYSNEQKINQLSVCQDTLEKYGAVSEQTATEMALGLTKRFPADIAIAVTGIAGPSGGNNLKPVGLVYVALNFYGKVTVKKYNFTGDRKRIRQNTVNYSFKWILDTLSL